MQNSETLPRREREKIRQCQEILDCALNLFSEKGYHNVTMHEIAAKAEFAIGTLYKFFQNKEDLYKALILKQRDKFANELSEVLNQKGNEVEKLRNYIRVKGKLCRANLPFIRLFLAENRGATFNIKAGLDKEERAYYLSFLEKLAAIFESGVKNGLFRKISTPYYLAIALDSVIDSFLLLWLEAPERFPFPEDPDVILDIISKGLITP